MAAATPTTEYDFDSWSEADEDKAIAALVPDVRHIIVQKDKLFVGRFTDLDVIEMPLTLSLDDIDSISNIAAPVDQFKHLLTVIGGEEAAASFSRHPLAETTALASRYFAVMRRIGQASLPE